MKENKKQATIVQAFIPIVFLIFLLFLNVKFFPDDTLSGSNQIALLLSAAIAGVIAKRLGYSWKEMKEKIVHNISSTMPSMLILLLIGSLAGTWLLSGVVPAMIYYGLQILNPKIFLLACVIVCALVSLATGSSWSTIATIGIAFLGIGKAMGFNEGVVAGAIISGAYFGDKMSPMSDTTNLAPAMAGTDLFTHIRYMLFTTGPSIIITLIIFFFIGLFHETNSFALNVDDVLNSIEKLFTITPLLFIVPVVLIIIIIKKVAPIPALMIGTLLGGIFALLFQKDIVVEISNITNNYYEAGYIAFMKSMFGEITIKSDNATISDLLSTGGMHGMLNTVWLIMSAMVFSGVMESANLLKTIANRIIRFAKSTGSLVSSTVFTSIFFNVTASDQYLAIVVPGRMFSKVYKERGYKPELLSRSLEDSGTVTSVLIPWNTCGATQASVLGVSTLAYLPFTFFCLLSPFMSIIIAYLGIKIRKTK